MITEDYVSFEVAKILKEKGFDIPCMGRYSVRSKEFHLDCTRLCNNGGLFECSAPTLQMAMKWLREVHEECIIVYPIVTDDDGSAGCLWQYSISKRLKTQHKSAYAYEFYEQACEEAIKHCLINLI